MLAGERAFVNHSADEILLVTNEPDVITRAIPVQAVDHGGSDVADHRIELLVRRVVSLPLHFG